MSRDSVYQQLRGHLAYLKLAATAEALPGHLEAARRSDIGHTEFLEGLLRVEVEATETRRWNSRMRGNVHVRFGGRGQENPRPQGRRASRPRPNICPYHPKTPPPCSRSSHGDTRKARSS